MRTRSAQRRKQLTVGKRLGVSELVVQGAGTILACTVAGINVDAELVALSVDVGAKLLNSAGEDVRVRLKATFRVAELSLPAVIDVDVLVSCGSDSRRCVQP
eukprot:COSAG02_NODE_777_length_17301_cov_8.632310_9_plen_102_part_00